MFHSPNATLSSVLIVENKKGKVFIVEGNGRPIASKVLENENTKRSPRKRAELISCETVESPAKISE
jgi:hypothetical protein